MKIYLWTVAILLSLETLGRIIWLVKGSWPERTAANIGTDLAVNMGFMVWTIVLLVVAA